MAAQKKKTTKKPGKNKTTQGKESDVPFFLMFGGWLLLVAGVVLLLGCISSSYSGPHGNWLGPVFGGKVPRGATLVFGRVSVIFVSLSMVIWGLFMAFRNLREKILRLALGFTLLTFNVSFLMALKNYGTTAVAPESLKMAGGVIGQFFSWNIAFPIFGAASAVAPKAILIFTLVVILVVFFGLRPKHFQFIAKTMRWLAGLFRKKKSEEETEETDDEDDLPDHRGVKLIDDETMIAEPEDFKIRRRGVMKPFNGRSNWLDYTDEETRAAGNKTPAGSFEDMETMVTEGPRMRGAAETMAPEAARTVPADDDSTRLEEDPEIARLEQELRENERRMSALQIKEIKDKIGEIRRARDLLNWEKDRHGRMVVKGAVRGDSANEAPEAPADDRTVMAGSSVAESAPMPDVASERTSVSATRSSENTFAGDNTFGGEFPSYNTEESSDDDTFIPQVVTSDEVGEDPTYIPPNQIGTASSAGIPQRDPTAHYDEYKIPTVADILDEHEPQSADYTEEELQAIGRMLEEKLENYKIKGKVVGCETGPVITRFEVEPGPGVKVSQFSALQDDLAMALKATSIRILAPIPGKGAVGIEIPNRKMQTIYGRDIFESEAFSPSSNKILMALGKDISGEPFAMDLAKAPHLMIAGQTGSGKSVCINALMASMLLSKTPDELRMILVDPKAVELKMYENIPHLLAPVITKPEIAIQALQWLCYEMDRRTEVLALAKVRNLLGFNEKFEAGELPEEVPEADRSQRMAFIVVIIDEMADLMMVAGKEIEKSVSRLAAKARAVGIHLVLATQRPSVKVITGNIKANLPTRISFKVASQVDARTVMDHAGAEKLLGRGDMLYKAVNAPDPIRVHGAFLSDEEAERLADACSDQNVFYPQIESFDVAGAEDGEDGEGNAAMNEKLDKLLFDVAKWAIEVNGLSTSAVQRHFSVGYSRAGKIVDQLYGLGICGPSKGNSKPRAMLVDMDGLMNLERSGRLG